MKATTALTLTHDLMQVMRQFPRLKFREDTIADLTTSEKGLLAMLGMNAEESKVALTATDISNLLQITPAGVTHLLNPLEEHGYIERLPDAKDRRIVRIGLTQHGVRTAKVLAGEAQRRLMRLIEHLGEHDSRNLIRLLSRAIEYFAAQPGT
jgi:DNA-binding MarR family transcriptional regulator